MFSFKSFVLTSSIVIATMLASGCQSPNPNTVAKPSASATPVASASPSPLPSPSVSASPDSLSHKKIVATTTLIANFSGTAETVPGEIIKTSLKTGKIIDFGSLAIIGIPDGATEVEKIVADEKATIPSRLESTRKVLSDSLEENGSKVIKFNGGRYATISNTAYTIDKNVIAHSFYSNLSVWKASTKTFDLLKDNQKVGELTIHSKTDVWKGEKTFSLEFKTLREAKVNIGSTPVMLSVTPAETTKTVEMGKVVEKNPKITFDDKSWKIGFNDKVLENETIFDITFPIVLDTMEKVIEEMEAKAKK